MRWLSRRKTTPQSLRAGEVVFVGEQDGPSERDLKQQLAAFFKSGTSVESAYLAIVSYDGGSERNVALCLAGVTDQDRAEVAKAIGKVFTSMFNRAEHLDIMFPNVNQQARLREVCQPFFIR